MRGGAWGISAVATVVKRVDCPSKAKLSSDALEEEEKTS